jgi:hypothetical protein
LRLQMDSVATRRLFANSVVFSCLHNHRKAKCGTDVVRVRPSLNSLKKAVAERFGTCIPALHRPNAKKVTRLSRSQAYNAPNSLLQNDANMARHIMAHHILVFTII